MSDEHPVLNDPVAEQNVVAACLVEAGISQAMVALGLRSKHFTNSTLAGLFSAIATAVEDGRVHPDGPVPTDLLRPVLIQQGDTEVAERPDLYHALMGDGIANTANAGHFAKSVLGFARRRELIEQKTHEIAGLYDLSVPIEDAPSEPGLPVPVCLTDFVAQEMTLSEPVIDGLIRRGETATMVSNSKAGKTWTVAQLALEVGSGGVWMGRPCREGRVLLVDAELQPATLQHRLIRVATHTQTPQDALKRVDVATWRGRRMTISALSTQLSSIERGRYDLIILDPIYRLYPDGFDENSNAMMAQFFYDFQELAERADAAVLVVAHQPKGDVSARSAIDLVAGAGGAGRGGGSTIAMRNHTASEPGLPVVSVETVSRSFPPVEPTCWRWQFPTWEPAPELDPDDIASARTRRKKTPEPVEPPVDPVARAVEVASQDPEPEVAILTAMRDGTTLSARAAKQGLTGAIAKGLIHRWTFGAARPNLYATIPQTEGSES